MARIIYVKKAQQRYKTVPVLDENGNQKTVPVMRRDGVTPKTTKTGRAITRRLTMEDKTQPLPPRRCEVCRQDIAVGTPYKWVAPKSGPYGGSKRYRCGTCPSWKPSELSSAKFAPIMAAQEDFDTSGYTTKDEFVSALDDFATIVEEVGQEYIDSADNMEDGFGHETAMSTDLRDKGEALNDQADDIRNGVDDIDDEPDHCDLHDTNIIFSGEEPDDDEAEDVEGECDCQERFDQWIDELQSAADDAINSVEY
jgi:hypothetical protein